VRSTVSPWRIKSWLAVEAGAPSQRLDGWRSERYRIRVANATAPAAMSPHVRLRSARGAGGPEQVVRSTTCAMRVVPRSVAIRVTTAGVWDANATAV